MTPAEPHPLRCETCNHKVPYPKNATGGAYKFLYCDKTKKFLTDDILKDKAIELFSIVGCASHSSAKGADTVLEELEKLLDAYVEENKVYLNVGIKVGTVRRMITIAKKRAKPRRKQGKGR